MESSYNKAIGFIETEHFQAAYEEFVKISDYKDASEYLGAFVVAPSLIEPAYGTYKFSYDQTKMTGIESTRGFDYYFDEQGSLIRRTKPVQTYYYTYNEDGTIRETQDTKPNYYKLFHQYGNATFVQYDNVRIETFDLKREEDDAHNILSKANKYDAHIGRGLMVKAIKQ